MKSNKLRILALTIVAILVQGTCTYAASSSDDDYTKEELNNLTPGFENKDIKKSNYKVNSYTNSFSSPQISDEDDEDDDSTTIATTNVPTIDISGGNVIVTTSPSTGYKGDFWGKTSDGKWILIEQGVPARGWRMVRGRWYYMDPDGIMQTGWLNDNGTWYYLNSGGDMAYSTIINGYYLDSSGAMQ